MKTIKNLLILSVGVTLLSCGDDKPIVNSPFSHLDTVKTKPVEKKEEPKKEGDGTSFSPFDKIK